MNRKKLKFWIGAMGCFVCMSAGVMHINLTNSTVADNVLVLHNAEALVQGENAEERCIGTGTVFCGGVSAYYGIYN